MEELTERWSLVFWESTERLRLLNGFSWSLVYISWAKQRRKKGWRNGFSLYFCFALFWTGRIHKITSSTPNLKNLDTECPAEFCEKEPLLIQTTPDNWRMTKSKIRQMGLLLLPLFQLRSSSSRTEIKSKWMWTMKSFYWSRQMNRPNLLIGSQIIGVAFSNNESGPKRSRWQSSWWYAGQTSS